MRSGLIAIHRVDIPLWEEGWHPTRSRPARRPIDRTDISDICSHAKTSCVQQPAHTPRPVPKWRAQVPRCGLSEIAARSRAAIIDPLAYGNRACALANRPVGRVSDCCMARLPSRKPRVDPDFNSPGSFRDASAVGTGFFRCFLRCLHDKCHHPEGHKDPRNGNKHIRCDAGSSARHQEAPERP